MPHTQSKLKLPFIEKVTLRRFSLYTANPDASFSCGDGVMCLVGANGIGKSTLLSAINFCLTGIVPDPNRAFESMEEYYKFTKAYSTNYFRGRILGTDEDDAEITVLFRLGPYRYELRRGMFEPDELRGLTIIVRDSGETLVKTEDATRSDRHRDYATHLVNHSGLSSFEEFVFLQHFVFTFDEQRKTLFWNQPVLERALYRAFGVEPNMAKRADSMRREIEQEDSRVRNYQWEATRMRKRINDIRAHTQAASGAQQNYDALIADHEALSKTFEEDTRALRTLEDALRDANLRLAEESVRETALRDEYARFFEQSFDRRPPLAQHPIIRQSLSTRTCAVCGAGSETALRTIESKAHGSTCPLCESEIQPNPSAAVETKRLQELDQELTIAKQALRDTHKTLEKLRSEEAKARTKWDSTKATLDEFDRENSATLESLREVLSRGAGDSSLVLYRQQLGVLERDKETAYTRREELKGHLLNLQRSLEGEYLRAEQEFVPRFAQLASHFLGMPLSVQLEARATRGLDLIVTVRGATRRQQQQLSESQRFFLDIALRMALTQHMSHSDARGGMMIDTPEGSLDIAYEKRAGDMLAMYAESGHQVVMTANLNSSQLLLALARRCGRLGMRLCKMMDWAELSAVQREEEELFETAYEAIEKALDGGLQQLK